MAAGPFRRWVAARRRFRWVGRGTSHPMRARYARGPDGGEVPIVLLSGLALTGHYMLPVGAELARRTDVWVPDLPGYARRLASRAALPIPELADAVVSWLDTIGVQRAAFVGNSAGCQVAVEVAARHPERVTVIILEGPTIDAEARSLLRQAWRVFKAGRREPASLGPLQFSDWIATGLRGVIGAVRHAFAHRIEDRLPDVACPALVVRGGLDPIVPQRWAERVTAGLPDGSLRVVPDAGHALTYSTPRVLADIVEDFVDRAGVG